MFQHYALFRHMSVFENVAFGLRVRRRRDRPSPEAIAERAHRLLELVQLDGPRRALPLAALGRPAPARRARAGARGRAQGAPSRRALRGPGRARAQGPAPLAAALPRRDPPDDDLRDPRPGGGARDRRRGRDHEPGPGRAGRHAPAGLRQAGDAVRLPVPRQRERAARARRSPAARRRPAGARTPRPRTARSTCARTTSSSRPTTRAARASRPSCATSMRRARTRGSSSSRCRRASTVEVEISRSELAELDLKVNDLVRLRLRQAHSFDEDYAI